MRIKQNEPERLVCVRCGFVFYLDPKVAVGTIIRDDDGRIVLVRRAIEPGYGKWVYPGGYVDRGELVKDAAVREAREEAGLQVRLDRLINVYSYPGRAPVVIVYAASILGGTPDGGRRGARGAVLRARRRFPGTNWRSPARNDALREYLGALAARR